MLKKIITTLSATTLVALASLALSLPALAAKEANQAKVQLIFNKPVVGCLLTDKLQKVRDRTFIFYKTFPTNEYGTNLDVKKVEKNHYFYISPNSYDDIPFKDFRPGLITKTPVLNGTIFKVISFLDNKEYLLAPTECSKIKFADQPSSPKK